MTMQCPLTSKDWRQSGMMKWTESAMIEKKWELELKCQALMAELIESASQYG